MVDKMRLTKVGPGVSKIMQFLQGLRKILNEAQAKEIMDALHTPPGFEAAGVQAPPAVPAGPVNADAPVVGAPKGVRAEVATVPVEQPEPEVAHVASSPRSREVRPCSRFMVALSEEDDDEEHEEEEEDEDDGAGEGDTDDVEEEEATVAEHYLNVEAGARVNCKWAAAEWYEGVVPTARARSGKMQKVKFDLDGVTTSCRLTNLTCVVLS